MALKWFSKHSLASGRRCSRPTERNKPPENEAANAITNLFSLKAFNLNGILPIIIIKMNIVTIEGTFIHNKHPVYSPLSLLLLIILFFICKNFIAKNV